MFEKIATLPVGDPLSFRFSALDNETTVFAWEDAAGSLSALVFDSEGNVLSSVFVAAAVDDWQLAPSIGGEFGLAWSSGNAIHYEFFDATGSGLGGGQVAAPAGVSDFRPTDFQIDRVTGEAFIRTAGQDDWYRYRGSIQIDEQGNAGPATGESYDPDWSYYYVTSPLAGGDFATIR